MGERNFLIEGLSGSGKTSVAEALSRRGHHVIHGDRVLAFTGDPDTGASAVCPDGLDPMDRLVWRHQRWIWPEGRVRSLIADQRHPVSFFCGGSRNHARFLHLFDGIFVLEADLATLTERLMRRPPDEFGGTPLERSLVARLHKTREDLPKQSIAIDATAPLETVVDDILSRCGLAL